MGIAALVIGIVALIFSIIPLLGIGQIAWPKKRKDWRLPEGFSA